MSINKRNFADDIFRPQMVNFGHVWIWCGWKIEVYGDAFPLS